MSNAKRKRVSFRPSVTESRLEERLVLSSGTGVTAVANPAVVQVIPSPVYAELALTPPPAAPPVSAARGQGQGGAQIDHPAVAGRLREASPGGGAGPPDCDQGRYRPALRQWRDPHGAADWPTSRPARRVPSTRRPCGSRPRRRSCRIPARLVSAVQNEILGSGARSLASRLVSLAQSGKLSGSTAASSRALARLFNTASQQTISQINHYFNTTPVNRLSVNAAGSGSRWSSTSAASSSTRSATPSGPWPRASRTSPTRCCSPTAPRALPTQAAMNAFTTQYDNALATAAYQLGSGLSLFPGSSSVVSQIQPILFGAANAATPAPPDQHDRRQPGRRAEEPPVWDLRVQHGRLERRSATPSRVSPARSARSSG